uniref:PGG domain-containing protein n=1 Tax=Panagrellus redivivus TaxID=6233 RepID=A0A7E5A1E1_PANRE
MNNTLRMFFNGAAYHGPPLALSFLSNAILGESADSITPSVEVYSSDNYLSSQEDGASVKVYFANMLTILCFSFLTSLFVMPLVDDRISRFKHQLLLTNLNQFSYWFSVTLFFLIIYTVFCWILSLILFFSGWMETCL